MKLQGQTALITGSGSGIGRAIAQRFAENGATILINDMNAELAEKAVSELTGQGYKAYPCIFNVTDRDAIKAALDITSSMVGDVSILVNNAGISPKKDGRKVPVWDMEFNEWSLVVDVNLHGVFNCSQAVIPDMIEKRRGKIINMSSASARVYTEFTGVHYIATKAAVIGLTHALCGELAKYNINVNALAPGRIWSDMARLLPKEVNDAIAETIPMKRFGEISEVVDAALFLAGSESDYLNGATLDVNGGMYMG